jgi:hypothetical protein
MSQQSVRQAARRSALDAQAVLRKNAPTGKRRLEAWVVDVLTALGERDGAVRDAGAVRWLRAAGDDRRRGSVGSRGAEWCGSGVTVREVTRLRRLVHPDSGRGTR